ncbi:MAG: lysylphosphatidylglycerol synthase transmembrane domain-containing protein [Bacteroidales bacterium]
MKQKIFNLLKILLSLGLGVYIFWLVYRRADIEQIKEILSGGVSYPILLVSAVIGVLSHIARAKRWKMLLLPLGVKPSVKELTYAIFVNYGVNIVLPRVGEFTRCGMVAKRYHVKFTEVVGTLVSERLTDVLTVGFIVSLAFIMQIGTFMRFFRENETILSGVHDLFTSVWFYLILLLIAFLCYVFFKSYAQITLVSKTKQMLRNLWLGICSITKIPSVKSYLFYSILIWFLYYVQLYVMMQSFDFMKDVSPLICFVAFAMTCIAGIVPVQGGIGAWHFAVITTLVYYGIGNIEAAAFAFVAHLMTMLLNAAVGTFGFIKASQEISIDLSTKTSKQK